MIIEIYDKSTGFVLSMTHYSARWKDLHIQENDCVIVARETMVSNVHYYIFLDQR